MRPASHSFLSGRSWACALRASVFELGQRMLCLGKVRDISAEREIERERES